MPSQICLLTYVGERAPVTFVQVERPRERELNPACVYTVGHGTNVYDGTQLSIMNDSNGA